jgi:hypothetical protein
VAVCAAFKFYYFWEELRAFFHHEQELGPENKRPGRTSPRLNGGHGLSGAELLFNDLQ